MQITQQYLTSLLIAADIPAWGWKFADDSYETVSADWVRENWRAWLNARPAELCIFGDSAGVRYRAAPLWIADACDCDNLALGVVAHAQVGNALSAQKTRLPRGGLAFGFLFYTAGPARPENFNVAGGHAINWFLDHDQVLRFFEPGRGESVDLNPTEKLTACFGFAA